MTLSGMGITILVNLVLVCLAPCIGFRPLMADSVVLAEQRRSDYVGELEMAALDVVESPYSASQDVVVQQ